MMPRECSRPGRADGSLNLQSSLALCCGLLAMLLLAHLLSSSRSEKPLDTRGWRLSDFPRYLEGRGLQFHVLPAPASGRIFEGVYLTEDPSATWAAMENKSKTVEYIHQWQGTVWVERVHPSIDMGWQLAEWGRYGCRIGDFILFGDEQVLQRIQEGCR